MTTAASRPQTIRMTMRDGGLVMEALAEYPFKTVFELIGKLNQQANLQSGIGTDDEHECEFSLANHELALIIKALGELPFNRVHALLSSLQAQIAGPRRRASGKG
ncbi:MAG TPA: hypothetical protein VIF60_01570 [Burkholderiaceae bacterium]|jgi:hypothetical protein